MNEPEHEPEPLALLSCIAPLGVEHRRGLRAAKLKMARNQEKAM